MSRFVELPGYDASLVYLTNGGWLRVEPAEYTPWDPDNDPQWQAARMLEGQELRDFAAQFDPLNEPTMQAPSGPRTRIEQPAPIPSEPAPASTQPPIITTPADEEYGDIETRKVDDMVEWKPEVPQGWTLIKAYRTQVPSNVTITQSRGGSDVQVEEYAALAVNDEGAYFLNTKWQGHAWESNTWEELTEDLECGSQVQALWEKHGTKEEQLDKLRVESHSQAQAQ
ncbi:hypothetical protein H2200_010214 [Cladophialophora chaetospira]|uniref:Uncharacterized protein n=1 Tax=Cladophialophora chaetospira TaxID=386627 RepID=A0AA39CEU5_9EURO|nr:hypothetical protein H2200_010214 [Cladophialophora chaetospira]